MRTNHRPFARKYRQFSNQAKKIKQLHNDGKFRTLSENRQRQMVAKLKKMYTELRGKLQHWKLRKSLVGLSFLLLGAGNIQQVNAQVFDTPELNPFDISVMPYSYNFIAMADIDADGDLDLFSVEIEDNGSSINFSKNDGTPEVPSFEAPIDDPFGIQVNAYAINPEFTDIDNDGDLDLFIGTTDGYANGNIIFFENQGSATVPNFGPAQTNPFGLSPLSEFSLPSFVDIDGDGDQDIVASQYDSVIKYFENTGTPEAPSFAAPTDSPFGILGAPGYVTFMDFADIDNDGDLDLMAGTTYDDDTYLSSFYFAENTGTNTAPSFDELIESPFGLVSFESYLSQPIFADIDNDGDLDIFSGFPYNGVAFFENLGSAPTSADAMVETFMNTPYTFSETDFSFSDQDGDDFKSIKVTGLTSVGTLQLDGTDLVNDQIIDVSDISLLVFTPIDDEEGAPYDTFTFQVGDENEVYSTDHSMTINVGGVSTKDNLLEASLDIFPNPTTDLIQLKLESVNTLNNVRIKLIDMNGRLLAQQSATIAANVWQQQFDLSKITAGTYFIQIDSAGRTISTQFVKK